MMGGRSLFIYTNRFEMYRFNDDHPFHPRRLQATVDLLRETGILRDEDIVPVEERPESLLYLFHNQDYIEMVRRLSQSDSSNHRLTRIAQMFGLGTDDNPVFTDMHEASWAVVRGTITALNRILVGQADHAVNLAGGLHHAQPGYASGFCIYNDLAIAIRWALQEHDLRVAYVDIDVHHGDGVQNAFESDPRVLTVSLHQSGEHLFPGSGEASDRGKGAGEGTVLNIPLEPFTDDQFYQEAFRQAIDVVRDYGPDLLVSQHGCDGHHLDPLAHLNLTNRTYRWVAETLHNLAHETTDGRWLAVGGGGYRHLQVVPLAWSTLWSEMTERPLPERTPESWRQHWDDETADRPPASWEEEAPPLPRHFDKIMERNRRAVSKALNH